MDLVNIGMQVSGSILARYGRGVEGDHSMVIVEVKKIDNSRVKQQLSK